MKFANESSNGEHVVERLPEVERLPRVNDDIEAVLDFVSLSPWGDPAARKIDLRHAIERIRQGPELNNVDVRRRDSGIELWRHNAKQFVVIYAYFSPFEEHPHGFVSIRAVRHSRLKNVFRGVRETPSGQYGNPSGSSPPQLFSRGAFRRLLTPPNTCLP